MRMPVIKKTIDSVAGPFTRVINLFIFHGIVPDEVKIARVIPVFKADDQSLFTNYRPISIFPSFSKFFERVIYNPLINYSNKLEVLSNSQYGLRKGHSATLALIDLYDKISSSIDRCEFSIGVFLDLSKAFDTVDHSILLDKLQVEHYGIRGLVLEWVKTYLTSRLQFDEFNGHSSFCHKIVCGVPQGSILGPLFFLIYVNDLSKIKSHNSPIMSLGKI